MWPFLIRDNGNAWIALIGSKGAPRAGLLLVIFLSYLASEVHMGVSDPEIRKKVFGPKWLELQHVSEKQGWPWWKRLLHRFQHCPICSPDTVNAKD